MPLTIPLRNDLPSFDLEVVLEGVTYNFFFYWNTREKSWYFNLNTETGDPIITSVRVVLDLPLGRRTANPLRPPGALFAVDTSDQRLDPSWDPELQIGDLGDRVQLMYIESTEMPVTV